MGRTASGMTLITERGEKYFPGNHIRPEDIVKADDTDTIAWSERVGTGIVIMKNNEAV